MKSDKIEHLFEFLPKSKIKAAEGKETGRYPFYTSSEIQSKYINSFLYYPDCLIFGTGGKSSIHLAKNQFATSTDCIVITPKKNTSINIEYFFQYNKNKRKLLEK